MEREEGPLSLAMEEDEMREGNNIEYDSTVLSCVHRASGKEVADLRSFAEFWTEAN